MKEKKFEIVFERLTVEEEEKACGGKDLPFLPKCPIDDRIPGIDCV